MSFTSDENFGAYEADILAALGAPNCEVVGAPGKISPAKMDAFGKANGLTVVFAPWHPVPEYRVFKTGSLLSKNELYPSGLVLVEVDSEGRNPTPRPYAAKPS